LAAGEKCIMGEFIFAKYNYMRWAGRVANMGAKRHACTILEGNSRRKEATRKA
jgi:hypothetical protein